ncbi:MAG: flavodoxin-dependent (E)-4-hydroxy-3-methylbut-2-enyl-diphosphate synthase [Candidatus Eisenbacteria bacterium]|nr:flavodoxin-dependent (E)-4-hydroxy-3-methylbut-2-enyl-diphosphate synthase [Candidatus Eisenbacteria bacterium]
MTETPARSRTRRVMIGRVPVGGGAPVAVQSMTNTVTSDIEATVAQIARLAHVGCDIARVAVPDGAAADALPEIIARSGIPVVADIHFDHRLGLRAVEAGAHALRINPGNIGAEERVRALVAACSEASIPIRIGVNAGSLERDILERHGHPTAEAMVESAERHAALLEERDFSDIIVSLKSSDVPTTVDANRLMASRHDYPLHLGITEAGTLVPGAVRSSVGLGLMLADGLGDTIRVSLAAPPEDEVRVGREILRSLGLRHGGVTVVACPTCGRTEIDVPGIASEIERRTADIRTPVTVAVMGCVVNGPGEAREADLGVAGGRGRSVLFAGGREIGRLTSDDLAGELLRRLQDLIDERGKE